MFDLAPAVTEIFLAGSALALLMVGAFRGREPEAGRLVTPLAVMAIVIGLFLLIFGSHARVETFGGQFVTDGFAVYFKVLVLVGAAVCLSMSSDFLRREGIERFEFPVLALFSTVGMLMMVSANDLIALYLGLEIQSLALYVVDRVPSRPDPLDRGRAEVFRSRRARLGHAALRLLAGLRLHRHDCLRAPGGAAAAGPEGQMRSAPGRGRACVHRSPGSPSSSPRCRSTCGRPTSMRARRRR